MRIIFFGRQAGMLFLGTQISERYISRCFKNLLNNETPKIPLSGKFAMPEAES